MNNKCVLAFSGGLDTSFCVKYLQQDLGLEVHTVLVDTGGFSPSELEAAASKALALGAASHENLDRTAAFYARCLKYLVFGNVLRNGNYPLSVSAERVFQAEAIADYALSLGAGSIAHGSTGAGNDQFRFDMAFHILCPGMQIITPIRDLGLSRQAEIDYLLAKGYQVDVEKNAYSINQGLWGTTVGGQETLTSRDSLPQTAWPGDAFSKAEVELSLSFKQGEFVGIDGVEMEPVAAIQQLEAMAAPFGIGRDIHVGDTILGGKGRVGFQAAAPLLVIKAHELLEKHVLSKHQLFWRRPLADWYGMMLHEGQFLEPALRDIEALLASSQTHVTGEVFVKLKSGHFVLQGIASDYDLMGGEGYQYGESMGAWTGEDARSHAKMMAQGLKNWHRVHAGKEVAL